MRLSRSEGAAVSRSSAIGTEDEKVGAEALEAVGDGARLDSPSMGALFRSVSMLPCILGSMVAAGRVPAAALPTCLWLHRRRPIQRGDPTAIMEQMWSRTGVLPSALLEVARFDSSLDLVRVPSRSAQQQHAPVLRTTSYPYGSAKRPM